MDCSIVIVNWNAGFYLKECIESLHSTIKQHSYEIVIVDNASTDGSIGIIKTLSNIRCLYNDKNIGFARANNQGVKLTTGKYILFLNPDTKVTEYAVDQMLIFIESHDEVGIVGPQLYYSDNSLQSSSFKIQSLFCLIIEHLISSRFIKYIESFSKKKVEPQEVDVVRGACLLIRRNIFEKLGGMNEELFLYSEETDLCFRTKNLGYKVYLLPMCKVYHYEGKSSKQQSEEFILFQYLRSKIIFYQKHYNKYYSWFVKRIILFGCLLRLVGALFTLNSERLSLFRNIYNQLNKI